MPVLSSAEALARLQGRFAIPEGVEPQTERVPDPDGTECWRFQWVRTYGRGGSTGLGHAVINARTGAVRSFAADLQAQEPGPAGAWLNVAEARARAEALLAEVPGASRPELAEWPWQDWPARRRAPDVATHVWVRTLGGIPYPGDRVLIEIDRRSGLCTCFELHWHLRVDWAPPAPAITPEQALAVFRDQLGVELWYQPQYELHFPGHAEPDGWRLTWRRRAAGALVGPGTSAALDGSARPLGQRVQGTLAAAPAPGSPPAAEPAPPAPPWDRTAAEAFLRTVLNLPLDWHSLPPHRIPGEPWEAFRFGPDPIMPTGVHISVDLARGLIMRLQWERAEAGSSRTAMALVGGTPTVGAGQLDQPLLDRAAAMARGLYPHLTASLRLPVATPGGRVGAFNAWLQREEHDVAVGHDGLHLTLAPDGSLLDLNLRWARIPLPPPAPRVTLEQALATLLSGRAAVLTWTVPGEFFPRPHPGPVRLMPVYRLLARPGTPEEIDAATGDDAAPGGLTERLQLHPHGPALAHLLSRLWVRLPDPDPDRPATRADLLVLLAARSHHGEHAKPNHADVPPGSTLAAAVAAALEREVLRPGEPGPRLEPGAPVTRAELCRWAARAAGFGELARAPLQVAAPWPDIDDLPDEDRRAAIFLAALGLLPWHGAQLRGHEPVSLGEAAELLAPLLRRFPG